MAETNSLTSKVYRSGKLRKHEESLPKDCWSWLSKTRLKAIAALAYQTAQASCLPDGERPFLQDGVPYATSDVFLDALTEELRGLLYFAHGTPLDGPSFGLLSDVELARTACSKAHWRTKP